MLEPNEENQARQIKEGGGTFDLGMAAVSSADKGKSDRKDDHLEKDKRNIGFILEESGSEIDEEGEDDEDEERESNEEGRENVKITSDSFNLIAS